MKVTDVRLIKCSQQNTAVRAYASVNFDNQMVVHDIKVIEKEDRMFIAFPSKKNKDGKYVDITHPLNGEFRKEVENAVLKAYEEVTTSEN